VSSVESPTRLGTASTFVVPPAAEWPALQETVKDFMAGRALVPPLSFEELQEEAAALVRSAALPEAYREFLLVLVNHALWTDVVAAIPFARRTLLLPPCLRSSASCRAQFDEYGLLCEECGRCCIGPLSQTAEKLGYAVLVAEGISIVEKLLKQGSIDAVIGVSCMPSLERSFPRMADHGIPGLAIPLLQEGCKDTRVIEEWVRRTIELRSNGGGPAHVDVTALRTLVEGWFEESSLTALLSPGGDDTARIGVAWLARTGKRWRPFLTAGVYAALRGCAPQTLPETVRRLAIAVECLHKASLVFDDIQDNDPLRYGEQTLHTRHGVPVAMTAGLYLLGQGYRLVAECGAPPKQAAEMVRLTAEGHRDLCRGQGAELWWVRHPRLLSPAEVLDIFRFKTAPAFEVGLRLGAILGGATPEEHAVLAAFSRNVGVAYQIRDDIEDFQAQSGSDDIQAGRLSILTALAADKADTRTKACIERSWRRPGEVEAGITRQLIAEFDAVALAKQALAEYKRQALLALRPLRQGRLKVLLHRLTGAMMGE
jgi:geranylgeranyl pyrophosphate synthase